MSDLPDGNVNAWKDLKGLSANIADWQMLRKQDAEERDRLTSKIEHAEAIIARETVKLQNVLAKLNLSSKEYRNDH